MRPYPLAFVLLPLALLAAGPSPAATPLPFPPFTGGGFVPPTKDALRQEVSVLKVLAKYAYKRSSCDSALLDDLTLAYTSASGTKITAVQEKWVECVGKVDTRYLYDVVDCDHVPGRVDGHVRPNALFAVGGLPFQVLRGEHAKEVVDLAEAKLLTPAGLRSLSPDDPQYRGAYRGGVWARDTAYHQGTVWPFLMGAFVEAWVRVRGGDDAARGEARRLFLDPLLQTLDPKKLGHLPEIAEGDAPHTPRGCPFQAWSVGEALRLDKLVLSDRN